MKCPGFFTFFKFRIIPAGCLLLLLQAGYPLRACWADEHRVVARVLSRTISLDEIQPGENLKTNMMQRLGPSIFEDWLRQFQGKTLKGLLLKELSRTYLLREGLMPEPEEIDGYVQYQQRRAKRALADLLNRREDLHRQRVASRPLEGADGSFAAKLAEMDRGIAELQERMRDTGQFRALHRQQAEEVVRIWKFHKALYHQYGGRVMCFNSGLEPVDAIQRLLGDGLYSYSLVILAPQFEDLLQGGNLPAGSFEVSRSEAEEYYRKPWWLSDYLADQQLGGMGESELH